MKTKLNENSLIKAGILFFIFSAITSIFNYLYQVSMIRMLGPADYGILGSLFAIIYIVTFSTSPINLVVSKNVAQYHLKEKDKIKYLYQKLFQMTVFIGLILLSIFIVLSPFIASYMKIDNISGVILVGIIAYFSLISVILTGTLNGMQKFIWQNLSGLISTLLKYFLAIFFVYLGFRTGGALVAIIIGVFISILFSYVPLRNELKNIKKKQFDLKKIYLYAIPVFISSILFILIITIDQILVKHFFSSQDAGIYAAAGLVAKIIWFGSSFLIGPLFPKVVSLKAQKKDTSQLLTKSLFYISVLVVLGCIILFIAPNFVVKTLYGNMYDNVIPIVKMFGVSLAIFTLIQIFMTYNLAVERYKFIYILAAGIIMEVVGIYIFHDSLLDIVKIVLLTNIFIFISFFIYNRKEILGINFSFFNTGKSINRPL